jgi:amino acid transporter
MSNEIKKKTSAKITEWLLGGARNPFTPDAFRHIALIAFLAWIGLGADGLSSSCYGPEESFLALGHYTHLAIYIAFATAITVFVISLSYNQVVELFPSGGGGYKVATELLGSHAGLISGAALIVDYVLTIAISIASGVDALFSLLPKFFIDYKVVTEVLLILFLLFLNLRGMKESVKVLLPIFLGFVIVHFGLIIYGIAVQHRSLPEVISTAGIQTHTMAQLVGWATVAAFLLHSYSLGSGTYTGLEAVSNNVNRLAEPRVRTAKITMLYMAISLSFMAAGIILLYLLWDATPVKGQTLNAVVFHSILGDSITGHLLLVLTLSLEAGILFVGANTGFLAGPVVLANMSVDSWLPSRFRHLSSRLVTQNGVVLYGLAAILIILFTEGKVPILVVLYSINVFLTFTLTLLGLCVYWGTHRATASKNWPWRLLFSIIGFIVTGGILIITLLVKFTEGGWITVIITSIVIILCLLIKHHYTKIAHKLAEISSQIAPPLPDESMESPPKLELEQPTAVFFIGQNISVGMHTLLWAIRMFPNHFKNFIFVSVGIVDIKSFSGTKALEEMRAKVESTLNYFVKYCQLHGIAAKSYADYGTDPVAKLMKLITQINTEFPDTIFFASKLIFENENWITRILHNETPLALQRGLHTMGKQLIILPMKI